MKLFTNTSEVEQAVQQVEKLMNELHLSFHHCCNGLEIEYKGVRYSMICTDNKDGILSLPRFTVSERIVANRD